MGEMEYRESSYNFDRVTCLYLVIEYLESQDWHLVMPGEFASAIWEQLAGEEIKDEKTAREKVAGLVLQQYAIVIHDCCRTQQAECHDRAWYELRHWLAKAAHRVVDHREDREDLVQETLTQFQQKIQQEPLKRPRTLWIYLLRIIQNRRTDLHRRRTAGKRQDNKIGSLEALQEKEGESRHAIAISRNQTAERATEKVVTDKERSEQLREFFQQHLSPLQAEVAIALYLDGLTPAEIAALMGKKSHHIRMIKMRLLQRLRSLTAAEWQRLRTILDKTGGQVDDER